ncbi:MAG: hypothetical protein ACRENG_10495, partial [bacterium]
MIDFLKNLKQNFSDTWLRLSVNLHETVNREGPHILYALAAGAALVQVAAANSYSAFNGLLALLGGIGTNLLADRIDRAADKDQLPALLSSLLDKLKGLDEVAAARVVQTELQNSSELLAVTDRLLEKIEALPLARQAFNQKNDTTEEREWFTQALQESLRQVGSRLQIEAKVDAGKQSAVAIGENPAAATTGGVAISTVHGNVTIISDAARKDTQLADIEQRYLNFVRREHGRIRLFGFLSHANIDVRLLDVFVSLRFSEFWREMEMKRLPAAEERDDRLLTPPEVLQHAIQKQKSLLILGGPGS